MRNRITKKIQDFIKTFVNRVDSTFSLILLQYLVGLVVFVLLKVKFVCLKVIFFLHLFKIKS
ncbi:hypothetical protein pgond44_02443 [Psychroflexus gondwanensis ACAM 44]|uniref:Uncharacterized protein n=1 Tax=Psychroflexus gondwanensis ACAM 44 TaxID=1189619 RepID=N1WXZ8_9FLAO|nr:hypothetical protein pgond44_02443 [Psychroflexus gondwanensis ACAM 44]